MRKLTTVELQRPSAKEFAEQPKLPLIAVLDNVRSLSNVGAVFRTADAFALTAVHLCGITACPPHREIHKTALGAEETVEWRHWPSAVDAVKWLREHGWTVIAAEQTSASVQLDHLSLTEGRFAIVFGNEVDGISEEVLAQCDAAVEIPQLGTKHSLNVAVSAGIVLYEFFHRLRA